MSDIESTGSLTPAQKRSTVHLNPSEEQKKQWLSEWKTKVQGEIDAYTTAKDKVYKVYKKQKDMYDAWLSIKRKKMQKYDTIINGRKKVMLDINKEIVRLSGETESTGSLEQNQPQQ